MKKENFEKAVTLQRQIQKCKERVEYLQGEALTVKTALEDLQKKADNAEKPIEDYDRNVIMCQSQSFKADAPYILKDGIFVDIPSVNLLIYIVDGIGKAITEIQSEITLLEQEFDAL